MAKSTFQAGVSMGSRFKAGETLLFVVSVTDKDATTYDLVEMTDEQGRQMAEELEQAQERRRIMGYAVSLFIDGIREHGQYAAGLSEWLGKKIPGERKRSKERK